MGETYFGGLDVGTFYPIGHTIRAFMIGHVVPVAYTSIESLQGQGMLQCPLTFH
jgi:hypothetical protein